MADVEKLIKNVNILRDEIFIQMLRANNYFTICSTTSSFYYLAIFRLFPSIFFLLGQSFYSFYLRTHLPFLPSNNPVIKSGNFYLITFILSYLFTFWFLSFFSY